MPTDTAGPIVDDRQPYATLHLAFDIGNTEWTFGAHAAAALVAARRGATRNHRFAGRAGVWARWPSNSRRLDIR